MREVSSPPSFVRSHALPPRWLVAAVLLVVAVPVEAADRPVSPASDSVHEAASPARRLPGGRGCRCDRFWVVSSRHCGQSLDERCTAGNLRYFRAADCGRLWRSSRREFLSSLPPGAPVCVFVHGSFIDERTALANARITHRWFRKHSPPGVRIPFVFFTWPSDGPTNVFLTLDVLFLGRRATHNGFYLAGVLDSLPAETPVGLIGHSHGARVVASTLHLLAGGAVNERRLARRHRNRRIRTVFAAAAMDNHWMNPGERYSRAWCATESLLHLVNPRDVALALYPLRRPFSRHALGRSGFERDDLLRIGPAARILTEFDVSAPIGHAHTWPNYTRHPGIARLTVPFVQFRNRRSDAVRRRREATTLRDGR